MQVLHIHSVRFAGVRWVDADKGRRRCKYEFCYICGLEWKTCACTRETPRRGRQGERQALREITPQAPAVGNARGPARPQVARPEPPRQHLAERPQTMQVQTGLPVRTAPRRAAAPEAPPTTPRGARGGRRASRGRAVTRAANIPSTERAATVSNVGVTRQARCQVHTAWRKLQRSGTCGRCRNFMPRFIFECSACGMDACARCSGRS